VAAWSDENRAMTLDMLRERWADDPRRADLQRAFRTAQPLVTRRLARIRGRLRAHALPSFIDDAAEYEHVRTLARHSRLVVVRGDFDGDDTLAAVGSALRAASLRLGVVYLSNVEQYMAYTPNFRRNFLALDLDVDAVVIRTLARRSFGRAPGDAYHYNVQSAPLFAEWLRRSKVGEVRELLRYRTTTIENGLSLLEGDPPDDIELLTRPARGTRAPASQP
jgi:hypothetical protein